MPGNAEADQNPGSSLYLPTDRALSRSMVRARERLADGEYQQALTFLHQVLTREEDSFLDDQPDATARAGLKATARRLIGELPPAGRDAFELLYGPAARRQLDAAAAAGDRVGVAQVVRQYYHTAAGYEAALLLAQMEADAGHYSAAAQLYQQLLDAPRAVSGQEPQLSVLAAINALAAGQQELAATTLRALIARDPSATIELGGRATPLPGPRADTVAWLTERVGNPEQIARAERNWVTLHGNLARNARHDGGGPHLRTRWQARVVNDPNMEDFLTNRARQYAERGTVVIPAARPISVGDVVLMRTLSNVVAVDWQTGKRIWETRDEEGLAADELLPTAPSGDSPTDWSTPAGTLEQRLWDDALSMSLTSDGERVFLIRGATISPDEAVLAWQIPMMGGAPNGVSPTTNQLAAFELATEGKLVWELDGARTTGELAGAFFLGAPLAVDNVLYVLAEIRGAVYLVALDPRTGKVEWQQRLVELEQGIALDSRRRFAGSTPSYHGGILVCPTAAGATVAVDVVRRELAWAYEYSRSALTQAELRNILQQQIQNQVVRANDHWLDSAAVIDDDRVYLTPPESQELHCVDLRTGAVVWKRPQGTSLFVGCVDKGIILLVGTQAVEAVRAVDGSAAWPDRSLPLPEGSRPAGQGYLSNGRYFLPLTNGSVQSIDVAAGKQMTLAAGEGGSTLGNLICVRGSVLSQSSLVLDKFEQIEVLERRAESALAKNADDPTAIRELAEMKRLSGRINEAVTLLKRAHNLAPNDSLVREMLVENLLDALRTDFNANKGDLPLVRRLVVGLPQELQLLRLEARGLEETGQRLAAWDAYERVAKLEAGNTSRLEIEDDYLVRSDRWLAGRMAALWSAATDIERTELTARIAAARQMLGPQPNAEALRQFTGRYGALPPAESARLQLAKLLVSVRQIQAAEIELLQLTSSTSDQTRALALALMTKGLVESGRPDIAAAYGSQLLAERPDDVAIDGVTARQWLQRLAKDSPALGSALAGEWPLGRVIARNTASAGPTLRLPGAPRPDRPERPQTSFRQLRIEQSYGAMAGDDWFISTDQLVGRNASGDDFANFTLERTQSGGEDRNAYAARVGQLLFVSQGGRVLGLDSRQDRPTGEGELLWQAYPNGKFQIASTRRGGRRAPQQGRGLYDDASGRRRPPGSNSASPLGPATPRGVVVYELDELKCVDPVNGELIWSRKDIPRGCELLGDDEFVLAADARDRAAYVIRMIDGELVGRRTTSDAAWMLSAGRNVAQVERKNVDGAIGTVITVVDLSSEKTLFKAGYQADCRMTAVEPNLVAIYEPTGKFQLLDVRRGKLLIDQMLEAYPKVQNIRADVSGERLMLAISIQVQSGKHTPIGVDYAPIDGLVYAFDLKTGQPLWPTAAVVRERFLSLATPADVPFFVFTERESQRGADGKLRLLCLDKETGASVYRNDDLPDPGVGQFRIRVERPGADADEPRERSVVIEMGPRTIRLTPTDQPRPPEPPAQDDLVAAREFDATGMEGFMQRIGRAIQDSQQDQQPQRRGRGRRGRQ